MASPETKPLTAKQIFDKLSWENDLRDPWDDAGLKDLFVP